jgi:hypothetical protein
MCLHARCEFIEVMILYVTPILSQVHGYAVRPCTLSQQCGGDRARIIRAASLSYGRHVINVDTKMLFFLHRIIPQFSNRAWEKLFHR